MSNPYAARTDGLPATGRAAWRVCSVCDKWVVAAWVDLLPTALEKDPLNRAQAIAALQAGQQLYRIRGGTGGRNKGSVVWQHPQRLARWMLDHHGEDPEDVYLEHPHHTFKPPEEKTHAPRIRPRPTGADGETPF